MKYHVVHNIYDLPPFSPEYPLFCDIESDGLYINPRMIQYYQPEIHDDVWILELDYFGEHTDGAMQNSLFAALGKTKEVKVKREDLKEYHADKWIVWWNGSYDQGTLRFGSAKVDDLWYMAKMGLPKLASFTLDVVTDSLFPREDFYKGLNKKELQKSKFKPGPLTDEQYKYGATDVWVMKRIWDKLLPVKDLIAYRLDAINLGYTVKWQQRGLKVNESIRSEAEKQVKSDIEVVTAELPDGLNVNSYKQVRALLDSDKSDASYLLQRVANGCEYSANIIKKRGLLKTLNFLEKYNRDRVYSHYNPYGTRTGRWAAKGGDREEAANLQQLPRKLKRVFGFEEGDSRVFVGADLPTAELRLAAAIYVDEEMVSAFKNDIDLHRLTASRDAGVSLDEVTDDMRKKAKASNFGLLYGMGPNKFQGYAFDNYGIVYTEEESVEAVSSWLNTYKGIKRKHDEMKRQFYKDPDIIVQTPMGRKVKPDMLTDALNIPIQGAVAEISKLWIHYMYTISGKEVPIATMVHDSVTLECYESEADYWKDIMEQAAVKAWKEYCKLPMIKVKDILMPVEVTVGKGYQNAS